MLPFLKPKTVAGVIIARRKPDGGTEPNETETPDSNGLHQCAKDLIDAVQAGDAMKVADALRAAFSIMESEPHEEYSDDEGDSE